MEPMGRVSGLRASNLGGCLRLGKSGNPGSQMLKKQHAWHRGKRGLPAEAALEGSWYLLTGIMNKVARETRAELYVIELAPTSLAPKATWALLPGRTTEAAANQPAPVPLTVAGFAVAPVKIMRWRILGMTAVILALTDSTNEID